MIIGTAGHIDHGKTALVKALTGVDASRLAEEKRRGITIDLGYAYHPLPDGGMLGFVDVPGHERFIHNMLAGATGIDHALLVVAADDGVMPQTREHLSVLQLLGIARGTVVVTKIDRVEAARRQAVREELRALLSASFLAQAPVFEVSSPSGAGIGALRAHLEGLAQHSAAPGGSAADTDPLEDNEPAAQDAGFGRSTMSGQDAGFRLAIDRVFTLTGVGTIVTGSAHSGVVAVGDLLQLAPGGQQLRVRSLHAQNRVAQQAARGERCALNITGDGLQRADLARGQWLISPALQSGCERFDAQIDVLAAAGRPIVAWQPVHLHHGAADLAARVVPLSAASIEPGQRGCVQIVVERPLHAQVGDRFVLRDQRAQHTIAGGRILDITPPARRRRSPERLALLQALAGGRTSRTLRAVAANAKAAVSLRTIAAQWNRDSQALRRQVDADPALIALDAGDDCLVWDRARWQGHADAMVAALALFHQQFADEQGCERDRLRRIATPLLQPQAARLLQDAMLADGRIAASGPWLHLPAHRVLLSAAETRFREQVLPLLQRAPCEPPWLRELAKVTSVDEAVARGYMLRLVRHGDVYQVVKDLFFTQSAIDTFTAQARALQAGEGAITAARFRDVSGVSRKRAIQILEFFDRIGITRRVKDVHRMRER